ncbi:MAG: prolyl oligopeptidase family serine peptidase [Rubripirellula sp.]
MRLPFHFHWIVAASLIAFGETTQADGPSDNLADQVRPIPPVGMEIDVATRDALTWRCKAIRTQWDVLLQAATNTGAVPRLRSLEAEILVFPRAVELALEFNQFYRARDLELASKLLDESSRRLQTASDGGDWAEVVGVDDGKTQQLVVGGFRSSIDGSFQPYGLVVPQGFEPGDKRPRRLDLWFHGRGETLSEVAFLSKQQVDAGQYTPSDTFVLHPYGRYSNAFKFAGEIDVLESLDYVRDRLPVDVNRTSVRGFSMGGAACWQFATHYSDHWFAANPGAGFSETPEFLRFFQNEPVRETMPDYQQTMWQLYDCPVWAENLVQCPTIAYSGEVDRQKQAADVMESTLKELGIDLVHVIGPDTAHKIRAESKIEIESRMASLAEAAPARLPSHVDFTTVTLRYHQMHWVDVTGLKCHWKPAHVVATVEGSTIRVTTENVDRLRLSFPSGQWPGPTQGPITVKIDGTTLTGPLVMSDRSWEWEVSLHSDAWKPAEPLRSIRKRPGLQGPIDDAFMSSFVFVLPTGESKDAVVQEWVASESEHAMLHWRQHFRGDIRRVHDSDIRDEQIASSNLILFGDPDSNAYLARIKDLLPVTWGDDKISLGSNSVPSGGHVPALIFPNPLNPDRYIVINSGFTFREYDYLNNARQTPKLPDWALIDVREGATYQLPGVVKEAGFFDEEWKP